MCAIVVVLIVRTRGSLANVGKLSDDMRTCFPILSRIKHMLSFALFAHLLVEHMLPCKL